VTAKKPRPGRIEGLLRSDNRRHRFAVGTENRGQNRRTIGLPAIESARMSTIPPIERGERAWRGNVASLKGCHCQGFLRIAVIRHGLRAVRAAQIDGSGSRRSHDAIPLVINRRIGN
jgi:hypothetical protein